MKDFLIEEHQREKCDHFKNDQRQNKAKVEDRFQIRGDDVCEGNSRSTEIKQKGTQGIACVFREQPGLSGKKAQHCQNKNRDQFGNDGIQIFSDLFLQRNH